MLCGKFLLLFFQIFFLSLFLSCLLWSYHYTYVGMLNCLSKIYKESEDMPWIRRKYLQIVYLINTYMRIKSSCNLFGKQIISFQFSSVQLLSRVWLFATPWITARQASLSITNSRSSLRLTSIESVMPSIHLILCRPLLLLPPIPLNVGKIFE